MNVDIRSRELAEAEAKLGPIPNGCAIRQPDGSWVACDASRAPIAGLQPFTGPDAMPRAGNAANTFVQAGWWRLA